MVPAGLGVEELEVSVEVAEVEEVDILVEEVEEGVDVSDKLVGVVDVEEDTEVGVMPDPVDISTAEVAPTAAAEETQVPATGV